MSIFKAFSKDDVIKALQKQAPDAEIKHDTASLAKHQDNQDGIVETSEQLLAFVQVSNKDDIKGVLKVARKFHLPIVPQSTGSSVVSGSNAIKNGIMISTSKMNQIIDVDPEDQIAVIQPGVINKALNDVANKVGMLYAPDPGSRAFSSIGGNVNTNAGGASAVRFGSTKDSVLGLTVILADGSELHLGGKTYKDSFGYDLTHLFVGSEGTLGIVTDITVKLFPIPLGTTIAAAGVFKNNATLAKAAAKIRQTGAYPSLMQALDANILSAMDKLNGTTFSNDGDAMLVIKIDGSNDRVLAAIKNIFNDFNAKQTQITDNDNQVSEIAGLAMAMFPAIYSDQSKQFFMSDLTVPLSKFATLMDYADQIGNDNQVTIFTACYAGDGTVHPIIGWAKTADQIPDNVVDTVEKLYRKAIELNGTITGEYSVGELKKQWSNLQLGSEVDYVQQQIKSVLDPMHLLNPTRKIN